MEKKQKIINSGILIFLPILFGGLIYVLFRSTKLLMFRWFEFVGIMPLILHLRIHHVTLPGWVLFSLPDALWVYSLTLFVGILWYNGNKKRLLIIFLFSLACGAGTECAQYFHLIPGYFDIIDLCFQILATVTAILSIHFLRKEPICLKVKPS